MLKVHRSRRLRGSGRLGSVGVVDRAAEGADTLEGPWDEVAIGLDGQLAALKGNRMLEIAHLTSFTDIAGAIDMLILTPVVMVIHGVLR